MEYLLLGMGISNLSLAKFFEKNKIKYKWYDDSLEQMSNINNAYPFLKDKIFEGEDVSKQIIIKSGSVKPNHKFLDNARIVISDLEFYYLYNNHNKKITVTGTNGKSTCVSLIKHLIGDIDMAGNIGIPLGDVIESNKDIVIEASSYMLEYINLYHSKYNVLLNITSNHLDHHSSMQNYIDSKMNLFKNCNSNDFIIYNYDDKLVRDLIHNLDNIKNDKMKKIPISLTSKVNGIYLMNNYVYIFDKPIMHIDEINLSENFYCDVLGAIITSYLYGVSIYDIRCRIKNFVNLDYRFVKVKHNSKIYYNDSKSTNIASLYSGLKTVKKAHQDNTITLICGGYKRLNMSTYDELSLYNFRDMNLHQVIAFGDVKEEVYNYFHGFTNCIKINRLSDLETKMISSNVILFSPGHPSYDEFESFILRGKLFEDIIKSEKNMKNH